MDKIPIDGYATIDPEIREPFIFTRRVEELLREEREKFRELLDAVPRISVDGDGDTWMHVYNAGINLSAHGGSIIQKNLLAWAKKMKQATEKARAILKK